MKGFIIFVCLIVGFVKAKINKDLLTPLIVSEQMPVNTLTLHANQNNAFTFPQTNFEINAEILYAKKDSITKNDIYKRDKYKPMKSCFYQGTDIHFETIQNIQHAYFTVAFLISQSTHKLYIADSNNTIRVYDFCDTSVTENFTIKINEFRSDRLQWIQFTQANSKIYVTDGLTLIQLPSSNNTSYGILDTPSDWNKEGEKEQFLKIGTAQGDIWKLTKNNLMLFKIKNTKIQFLKSYQVTQQSQFYDGYYQVSTKKFYLLQSKSLRIISNTNDDKKFDIQGTCQQISKIGSVIHLVCNIDKKSFVAEFYEIKDQLVLNRYYPEVEGVNHVFYLGNDKEIFASNDEMVTMGLAIPRKAIEDLGYGQPFLYSWVKPLLDYHVLKQYSDSRKFTILRIGVDEIKIHALEQKTPSMVCNLDKEKLGEQFYLTVVFNTSTCANYNGGPGLCQQWNPLYIKLTETQLDHKTSLLIVIGIIILIVTVILFVVGFIIKRVKIIRASITHLKNKIKKAKERRDRRKQFKPI